MFVITENIMKRPVYHYSAKSVWRYLDKNKSNAVFDRDVAQ